VSNIQQLFNLIKSHSQPKILITTHHKPDADALGSSLGLYNYLKNAGIESEVISPTDYGDFLKWMAGEDRVINYEEHRPLVEKRVEAADYIFCLDFNHIGRLNELGQLVEKSNAMKVLIDHHLNPQHFYNFEHWNGEASSTCELMYEVFSLWDLKHIDKKVAQCLYAGIMTDTGSFRFPSTHSSTHLVVSELLKFNIEHSFIHEAISDNFSENRTRFIGFVISQKLEVIREYNVALMTVTQEELEQYRINTGDTEGLVNFGLGIKGIKFAALIIDRKQLVKMSFRSKGNFPANEFAEKYFAGGGHFNAAGGHSPLSLEETVNKFKEALPEWKTLLQT
jgi:phosphoesterase RecJ-like protein